MDQEIDLFSRKNLDFILYEVLEIQALKKHTYFEEHDKESYSLMLDMATEISKREMWPYFSVTDREKPMLKDGGVKVHPSLHAYVKSFSEAGLIAATFSFVNGGAQLPKTIAAAIDVILCSAANSFIMYTDLAKGIANLIETFGSSELKETYLPNILSGKWLGTMCLTEPESGSSLANITTKAFPRDDGSYAIKGQKIFISAGDHDITDNIIHLVLARVEGSPSGTKGISLFIVPKNRTNGQSNDVESIGMYHKMGQKATPAMHLDFGAQNECIGYLLGEKDNGLKHMFQMMDGARLSVGAMGVGMASTAYYCSLKYAKERKQGAFLGADSKEPVAIIHHADVRRMLLKQKAFIEGALSFILQCYKYLDIQKVTEDKAEKKRCTQLLNLLTPVAKTYGAENGVVSVNLALQIFGGYGYTEDFPLEQLARDVRILPIYEGTTGIHSLGLLGRQIIGNKGENLKVWFTEVAVDLKRATALPLLEKYVVMLNDALDDLKAITHKIELLSKEKNEAFYLADASLFMDYFGILNIAWQWLKQGTIAQDKLLENNSDKKFYTSKLRTMEFFFIAEIPKLKGMEEQLLNPTFITVFKKDDEILM